MDSNYNTLCFSEMPPDIGYAQAFYYIKIIKELSTVEFPNPRWHSETKIVQCNNKN